MGDLRAYKEVKEDVSMSLVRLFSRGNILLMKDQEPLVLSAVEGVDNVFAHGSNKTVTFDFSLPNNEAKDGSTENCCSGCQCLPVRDQHGDGRSYLVDADCVAGTFNAMDGTEKLSEGGSRGVRPGLRGGELDKQEKHRVPSTTFLTASADRAATDTTAITPTDTGVIDEGQGSTTIAAAESDAAGGVEDAQSGQEDSTADRGLQGMRSSTSGGIRQPLGPIQVMSAVPQTLEDGEERSEPSVDQSRFQTSSRRKEAGRGWFHRAAFLLASAACI